MPEVARLQSLRMPGGSRAGSLARDWPGENSECWRSPAAELEAGPACLVVAEACWEAEEEGASAGLRSGGLEQEQGEAWDELLEEENWGPVWCHHSVVSRDPGPGDRCPPGSPCPGP